MPSQKLPLFNGLPLPLHNDIVAAGFTNFLPFFGPPDKALSPQGQQSTYEVHLWYQPILGGDVVTVRAWEDNVGPGAAVPIFQTAIEDVVDPGVVIAYPPPVKLLDGYPVRGKVTLDINVTSDGKGAQDNYPIGSQIFGYFYRVGQGVPNVPERRNIGLLGSDGIALGVPYLIGAGDTVVHEFQNATLDELTLGINTQAEGSTNVVSLKFLDANDNNVVAPGHQWNILPKADVSGYDPLKPLIDGVPFGGYNNGLAKLVITGTGAPDMTAWGFFTRRG